jgi:GAF domain-containing protein
VSSCDLKQDPNVGQQAKRLPFGSTYAIPVFAQGKVIAVLGVAFNRTVQLTPDALNALCLLPTALKT